MSNGGTMADPNTKIDAKTLVPLGQLAVCVAVVLAGYMWLDKRLDAIDSAQLALHTQMLQRTQYPYDSNNATAAWVEFNQRNPTANFALPNIAAIVEEGMRARNSP
jgi:hypothetical protein